MKDWRQLKRSGRPGNERHKAPNRRSGFFTNQDVEIAHQKTLSRIELAGDYPLDDLSERLKAAHPHLIVRVKIQGDLQYENTPSIREVDPKWDVLIDEGYDPNGSPLGPVYWRVIRRASEKLYCSSFLATAEQIIRCWGPKGLAYCNPATGVAVAGVETVLPESS